MLTSLATHARFDLDVRCKGDLHVDAHHIGRGRRDRARRGAAGRRSATRRASCASATPTCRSTRRSRARWSTSRAGPGCTSACSSRRQRVGDHADGALRGLLLGPRGPRPLQPPPRRAARPQRPPHRRDAVQGHRARARAWRWPATRGSTGVPSTKGSAVIAIVDYGIGNLGSVTKGFRRAGAEVVLTGDPEVLRRADALVLPGDGAFGATMDEIEGRGPRAGAARGRRAGHAAPRHLHRHAAPVRGERGARPAPRASASCPAACGASTATCRCRTWAGTGCARAAPHPLLDGVADGAHVYFVHSYYCDAPDDVVIATSDYGRDFPAIVGRGNVLGVQFHPEKSQDVGLRLVANFVARASPAARRARMIVVPAIDIRGGRVVRLRAGPRSQEETVYGGDPAEVARRWEAEGAERHPPRGPRRGDRRQAAARARSPTWSRAVRIPVEVGGGLRMLENAHALPRPRRRARDLRHRRGGAARRGAGGGARCGPRRWRWRSTRATAAWRSRGWNEIDRRGRARARGHGRGLGRACACSSPTCGATARSSARTSRRIEALARAHAACAITAAGGVSDARRPRAPAPRSSAFGVDEVIVGKALYEGRVTPRRGPRGAAPRGGR